MCCFFTALVLLGPRAAILIWWFIQPVRWSAAFDSFIVPFLGLLFLPWTTLIYVVVQPGGVEGFDIFWIGLGVAVDIVQWVGGAWGNRTQIQSTYYERWPRA
jgi:hypothetical protein